MNESTNMQDLKGRILSVFAQMQGRLNGSGASLINQTRKAAAESFAQTGFPTLKHENWKYANLAFIKKQDFVVKSNPEKTKLTFEDILKFVPKLNDAIIITLVNGFFIRELSSMSAVPKGLDVLSVEEAYELYPERVSSIFSSNSNFANNPLEAANTAVSSGGAYIAVKSGEIILNPVVLLNICDATTESAYISPRIIIYAGKRSQSTFIEISRSIGENPSFSNSVFEALVRENALMNYYKVINDSLTAYNIAVNSFELRDEALLNKSSVYLNGLFSRNNLNVTLNGERCEANLDGFYYSTGKNFIDNHTFVDHAKPNSYSNEFYKGIVNGESEAVFNGRILVRQDSQKTNAYQSNKNILLTKTGSMNTKPELEIYADDVKCSHGATIGSLDQTSMFYMRARGLDEPTAKALLLNAFAAEIINRIKLPELKDYILTQISERLLPESVYYCDLLK